MSFNKEGDRELVAEFKNGNTKVFDELMSRYSVRLYQTAYGLLSNHHDAEEVVQDTFVRAFRGLKQFRGDSNIETWLQRITINLARNKYHWNRRRGAGVNISLFQTSSGLGDSDQEEEIPLPDRTLGPERTVQGAETEKKIAESFEELPESLRETMILRHVHDMPYEEISKILKCKIGTVKSRLARGREMLKKVLKRSGVL